MTVKVYIWYPAYKSSVLSAITLKNVGHVSMQVQDIYISHRPLLKENEDRIFLQEFALQFISKLLSLQDVDINPSFKKNKNRKNKDYTKKFIGLKPVDSADSTNYTYEIECLRKKREADEIILIDGINEETMLNYYMNKKDSKYHPLKMNCSTFIANVIRNGLDCSHKKCLFCDLRDGSSSLVLKNLLFLYNIILLYLLFPISLPVLSAYIYNYSKKKGINIINFPIWTPSVIIAFIKKINITNGVKVCLNSYN